MAIEQINIGVGDNEDLYIVNREAVLNVAFLFFYDDKDQTVFDFPAYNSAYFNVFNERLGKQVKAFSSQLTRSANTLILNASVSDMTFAKNGKYYYELGYIRSGGYPIRLRYGSLIVE